MSVQHKESAPTEIEAPSNPAKDSGTSVSKFDKWCLLKMARISKFLEGLGPDASVSQNQIVMNVPGAPKPLTQALNQLVAQGNVKRVIGAGGRAVLYTLVHPFSLDDDSELDSLGTARLITKRMERISDFLAKRSDQSRSTAAITIGVGGDRNLTRHVLHVMTQLGYVESTRDESDGRWLHRIVKAFSAPEVLR